MEKIKRPKKTTRQESQIMSQKNMQEITEEQFNNIYKLLDEIVDYINGKEGK